MWCSLCPVKTLLRHFIDAQSIVHCTKTDDNEDLEPFKQRVLLGQLCACLSSPQQGGDVMLPWYRRGKLTNKKTCMFTLQGVSASVSSGENPVNHMMHSGSMEL